MEKFRKAIENPENAKIRETTFQDIKKKNNDILQQLPVSGEMVKYFHKKLKDYRFCSDIEDIKQGRYLRWIPLDKDPIDLEKHCVRIINIIETDDDNIYIKCTINNRYYFNLDFSKCLFFQKLTEQETLILTVIEQYLYN